ncbi:MAG: class I SAM-dependent methyltransferase [Salinibacter sp.]
MAIDSVLEFAHALATRALSSGDTAVDATVGNGHDTVGLARAVGRDGQVVGFDVQAEAIAATRDRLAGEGLGTRVDLIRAGHETMEEHVPDNRHGRVGAVMFNLGYLPGGDASLTTTPRTTLPALDAALRLLRPEGVLTAVLYTGHEGGAEEAEAVEGWAQALPRAQGEALSYRFVNQQNDPPRLIAVEKQGAGVGASP